MVFVRLAFFGGGLLTNAIPCFVCRENGQIVFASHLASFLGGVSPGEPNYDGLVQG